MVQCVSQVDPEFSEKCYSFLRGSENITECFDVFQDPKDALFDPESWKGLQQNMAWALKPERKRPQKQEQTDFEWTGVSKANATDLMSGKAFEASQFGVTSPEPVDLRVDQRGQTPAKARMFNIQPKPMLAGVPQPVEAAKQLGGRDEPVEVPAPQADVPQPVEAAKQLGGRDEPVEVPAPQADVPQPVEAAKQLGGRDEPVGVPAHQADVSQPVEAAKQLGGRDEPVEVPAPQADVPQPVEAAKQLGGRDEPVEVPAPQADVPQPVEAAEQLGGRDEPVGVPAHQADASQPVETAKQLGGRDEPEPSKTRVKEEQHSPMPSGVQALMRTFNLGERSAVRLQRRRDALRPLLAQSRTPSREDLNLPENILEELSSAESRKPAGTHSELVERTCEQDDEPDEQDDEPDGTEDDADMNVHCLLIRESQWNTCRKLSLIVQTYCLKDLPKLIYLILNSDNGSRSMLVGSCTVTSCSRLKQMDINKLRSHLTDPQHWKTRISEGNFGFIWRLEGVLEGMRSEPIGVRTTLQKFRSRHFMMPRRALTSEWTPKIPAMSLYDTSFFFLRMLKQKDYEQLRNTAKKLDGYRLRIGTTCSGSDIGIIAIKSVLRALNREFQARCSKCGNAKLHKGNNLYNSIYPNIIYNIVLRTFYTYIIYIYIYIFINTIYIKINHFSLYIYMYIHLILLLYIYIQSYVYIYIYTPIYPACITKNKKPSNSIYKIHIFICIYIY